MSIKRFAPIMRLPAAFLRSCWRHGIAAALAQTYEIVIRRRMALRIAYPYESPSNAAAWLPRLGRRPLISVVMPVYNSRWLHEAVASVLRQSYDNYELVLADDCSDAPRTLKVLRELQDRPAVRLLRTGRNLGISGATNAAIDAARGEYIGFMDHDDILHPDALAQIARTINQNIDPPPDIYFTDETRIDACGHVVGVTRKSLPTLDNLLACNAVAHFCVIRRTALDRLGRLNPEYDGAQDHDLMLRAWDMGLRFEHLPYALYGWRLHDSSASSATRAKPAGAKTSVELPAAYRNGKRMLQTWLERHAVDAQVTDDGFPWYRVRYALPQPRPEVGIIVPFHDQAACLRTLLASLRKTTYPAYRVYLVDNRSRQPDTRALLEQLHDPRCERLAFDEPFNYSRLHNVIVGQLSQEYLVFMNNDIEIITPDWLEALLEHTARPGVAATGCRLLHANGRLQHAGMTFHPGIYCCATHINDAGEHYPHVQREVAGVTAACMMIRRPAFNAIGGFDEVNYPIGFSDADLCLRLRQAGFKIMYTPFARMYHHESRTRRRQEEAYEKFTLYKRHIGDTLLRDPHYHTMSTH